MNIGEIDLNLLRVFDAVYQTRSVTRAAERLNMSQPAASSAIARLRTLLRDPLFARAHGGVRPTPAAEDLAVAVRSALALIGDALSDTRRFDPARSRRTFRFHMSDIGEARFLPPLMEALLAQAPGLRVECQVAEHARIASMLDSGELDFAIGFLPGVAETDRMPLVEDHYVVMVRQGHPRAARSAARPATAAELKKLDFVAVSSHSETMRILAQLHLEDRVRLLASHFLALPAIVRATDLAVVLPWQIAREFARAGAYAILEPRLPRARFAVSLHWGRRRGTDAGIRWMRELIASSFIES